MTLAARKLATVPVVAPAVIRPARSTDIPALESFIQHFTGDGTLLPRTRRELARHLRDFRLAVSTTPNGSEGELVGCGALQLVDPDLAEIRTVALHPDWRGRGLGRQIVEALLEEAAHLHLPRVFCLTRQVDFFARLGFTVVPKEIFPQKVWTDCRLCPRRDACDETAMELRITA